MPHLISQDIPLLVQLICPIFSLFNHLLSYSFGLDDLFFDFSILLQLSLVLLNLGLELSPVDFFLPEILANGLKLVVNRGSLNV